MNRIAVYFRVSTKKQDFAIQEAAFHDWYRDNGGAGRVYRFCDKRSGNATTRPSFDSMMNLIRQGQLDRVVVYAIDRFSRNKAAGLRLVLELQQHNVAFTSITQPFLSTSAAMPFQNVLLAAFTEIAAIERETIVRRVKEGLATARAEGKLIGKPTKLTREMHQTILRLHAEGLGARKLAEHFGVGHSLIYRALEHNIDTNISYAS